MSNDDNRAAVDLDDNGSERFTADFQPVELDRINARARVLDESPRGRRRDPDPVVRPGHHPHAGQLPHGRRSGHLGRRRPLQSHEVKRLYVGDSSLHPRTLSVNPSLTIMALATRLADHLDSGAGGQLEAPRREQLVA